MTAAGAAQAAHADVLRPGADHGTVGAPAPCSASGGLGAYAAWFAGPLALCPLIAWLRPGDGGEALRRGALLLDVERSLGLAIEPTVHAWASAAPAVMAAVTTYYLVAHLSAVIATACWLRARHPTAAGTFRTRFAVAQLITAGLYVTIPVAPLRLVLTGGVDGGATSWSRSIQYEYAALPSGHVVFAVLVAAAVWSNAPRGWRWLGPGHAAITTVVVVASAHHLLVDAVAALAVAVVAIAVSRCRGREPRRLRQTGPCSSGACS